jgi:hypothetical protein
LHIAALNGLTIIALIRKSIIRLRVTIIPLSLHRHPELVRILLERGVPRGSGLSFTHRRCKPEFARLCG